MIVFIRGWDYSFASNLEGKSFSLFKFIFFKADALIELSKDNKQRLLNWGYKKNIYLETTTVDDEIENAATLNIILDKYETIPESINILLLSRIEKEKGIFEAIDAFAAILSSNLKYKLIVAR
ncbi:MAG: hypothetical protein IPH11_00810 [Ignavibacteriales bacterium]|nr:hypothetical protein [Ignavibacteriales bacterium]